MTAQLTYRRKTTLDVLHTQMEKRNHSAAFQRLLRLTFDDSEEHKLKVSILSDNVNAVSRAHLHRWDGSRWQEVVRIPAGNIRTSISLCYKPGPVVEADFQEDLAELLHAAILILD